MVSQVESKDARRAERRRTAAPSTLRADAGGPVDAIVSDVSITGARISCAAELRVGQEVTVGLASVGAVRGIIMWRRDTSYGLAFAQPLAEEAAARAFTAPTVVQLVGRKRNDAGSEEAGEDSAEHDLYAEGTGWLSALGFTMVAGAVLAAALLRGMGW
ncbi:PilZ domain-containing protein [Sphingomonas bacterium]|uniref:PilZ domain-containing protein n=1 Tax=Sphingomonas bacterium TaxID=1895847 RepID=UPI00157551F4|nr:PilZ domain-containing protein [Sphingomonas bacterium]